MLQSFAMDDFIDELLKKRGIVTDEEKEAFFNPDYSKHLGDPFDIKDMKKAVKRIIKAIDEEEHIAIYSDFDADGIPGGALLYDAFTKVGHKKITNYIPHRNNEGYGFHKDAVRKLKKKGVTLIITVDVGIVDIETAKYAKKIGVSVIVTDHHIPAEELPVASAVIDPQRSDETNSFKYFCGTGVAFKVVQALFTKARKDNKKWIEEVPEGWEKWLLDLVAIATVADMVPLVGENRTLVHYGLIVLRKSKRPGIGALCKKLRINQRYLTEDDIGFSIGPRINASSRMGSPEKAFELLTTSDIAEAENCARELESLNNKRKGRVASMVRELKSKFNENCEPDVLVAGNPNWNPSLLGLASNSLVDTYDRTVCLWGRDGTGSIKGSCRGNGKVNIVNMFKEISDILTQFGGHEHAGGFALEYDNIHTLGEVLNKAYKKVKNGNTSKKIEGDLLMPSSPLHQTHKAMIRLSPFGIGNPKPIFILKEILVKSLKQFGTDGGHMELQLSFEKISNIRAIAFFKQPESFSITPKENERITVLGTVELSHFAGRANFELRILDIV